MECGVNGRFAPKLSVKKCYKLIRTVRHGKLLNWRTIFVIFIIF